MTDEDVLFSITDKNLDSGLRGVPVGTCQTSFVDPYEGVHYVGYPVEDLVNMEEEDVVFLLLNKHLPTAEESIAFRKVTFPKGPPGRLVTCRPPEFAFNPRTKPFCNVDLSHAGAPPRIALTVTKRFSAIK